MALSWQGGSRWSDANGNLTPDAARFVDALIRGITSSGATLSVAVTPSGSPFSYTSPGAGAVMISGGTVSAVSLVRIGVSTALNAAATAVPVSTGDVVVITYSSAPAVTWVPK